MTKPTNKALRDILEKCVNHQQYDEYGERIYTDTLSIEEAHSAIIKLFRECVPEKFTESVPHFCTHERGVKFGRNQAIEEMNARIEKLGIGGVE